MKIRLPFFSVIAFFGVVPQWTFGDTLYYDTNGSTGGTSTTSTQNLTEPIWTIDPTGSLPTTSYITGSDVVFSADDLVNVGTGTQAVTVTDTESANSLTFNNGTVTLYGSGSPNLTLGVAGGLTSSGITVGSAVNGATTLDSSLETVTLGDSQTWANNSGQALNINSTVAASGSTLNFGGSGTGNINLNGQLTGSLNLTATGAADTVYLANTGNNFSGAITANGGAIVAEHQSTLAGNAITLENGGTIEMNDTQGFNGWNNTINLGTGGGQIVAGTIAGGGIDLVYSGFISGGTGLTLQGGDLLLAAAGGSNIGALNVNNGRLLAIGSGDFDNNTVVNVSSGAIMDMGVGGTYGNQINLQNGGFLENRSGGVTLTDVVLPTGTATVTIGADDVGGGSITLNGPAITLTNGNTLTIIGNAHEFYSEFTPTDEPVPVSTSDPNYNSVFENYGPSTTAVHLEQKITGSGDIVFSSEAAPVINANTGDVVGTRPGSGSPIYLDGANDYSGTTEINGVVVFAGASGFGTSTVTMNSGPFNAPYDVDTAAVGLTGGNLANNFVIGTGVNVMNLVGGASDQTLSGLITLSTDNSVLVMENSSAATLNVGNIHFNALAGAGQHTVNFEDNGSGPIVLNGTYSSDPEPQDGSAISMNFGAGGENGTYDFTSTSDFTGMQNNNPRGPGALALWAGTLNIETDNFAGQTIDIQYNAGTNHTINFVGGRTLDYFSYVNIGDGAWTLSQSTADQSTTSGGYGLFDSTFNVSVVDGGRLNITGDVAGYSFDTFLTKTGAGTVVLSASNGNNFNDQQGANSNGVMADIQQGTLLINNTQGYAMGSRAGTVLVEKGATFGGSGTLSSGQTVVAEDATSVIAPGDAGDPKFGIAPTIGTLTIGGGLDSENGLTMDFKLNGNGNNGGTLANNPGENNDFLEIGAGGWNFGSGTPTVTINLTAVGDMPLLTGPGNFYVLIQGASSSGGDWIGNPNFVVNAPTGYALDPTFGTDDGLGDGKDLGYIYDNVGDTFYVQLIATPEPSTYGLIGLGVMALGAFRLRRRRQNEVLGTANA